MTTGAGAASVGYSYDTRDRLTTESGATYAYDANGNITSKSGEATYAWDFENRLTSVTMSNGTVVRHAYDVDGNRVQTSVTPSGGAATVTNFLVDAAGGLSHVVAESDAAGALGALYVRAANELFAVMRPGAGWTTRYVHHDSVGSVRALTDETGVVVDARGYEAFGTMNVEAGSDPLPYRFAGEPFDGTSKLAYHRARWMDSRLGRFAGIDPFAGAVRDPRSLHGYAYAANDPSNKVDPNGREFDLVSMMAAVNVRISIARIQLTAAFATGGQALGRAFQEFGKIGEEAVQELLQIIQAETPALVVARNEAVDVAESGGAKRFIDFFLRLGDRSAFIEVKYRFPQGDEAVARMLSQLNSAASSGKAQETVLFLVRDPTSNQVMRLNQSLGPNAGNVRVIGGISDLWTWLEAYLRVSI